MKAGLDQHSLLYTWNLGQEPLFPPPQNMWKTNLFFPRDKQSWWQVQEARDSRFFEELNPKENGREILFWDWEIRIFHTMNYREEDP